MRPCRGHCAVSPLPRMSSVRYDRARMYRSISTQAIVIRRERIGEFHKSLSS